MCFNVFGHCVTVRSSLLAVDSAAETITHPTNTRSHSLVIIEIMVDTGSVAIPNENLTSESVKVDFEIVGPATTMSVTTAVNAAAASPAAAIDLLVRSEYLGHYTSLVGHTFFGTESKDVKRRPQLLLEYGP